jgi:hypothetical protein
MLDDYEISQIPPPTMSKTAYILIFKMSEERWSYYSKIKNTPIHKPTIGVKPQIEEVKIDYFQVRLNNVIHIGTKTNRN